MENYYGKVSELKHLLVTVFLSGFANFIVLPALTDVTMFAVCPGQDRCSLAIYLSGFQQAIIGLGAVVMNPLIGNLSDIYGRKALLTLPMTLSILPLAIMAYSMETSFFYAYYVIRTLTAMASDGTINSISLAYVADKVSDGKRASAFGVLAGVGSAAFVCATLAARLLSTALTFQVAAFVSMLATVYMRIFLEDTLPPGCEDMTQPILGTGCGDNQNDVEVQKASPVFKKIPSVRDLICLLRSSVTFTQAAVVSFFSGLAEGGLQASVMYYLKARFHFSKNQYADLMLIGGIAGMVSQLLFMPFLTPLIAEEKLLSFGLLMACTNMLLYSISWSSWVPYASSSLVAFAVFAPPCLRSIASKQVGLNEQGKAQGCLSGISSFASIISPFIFSPLTAMFLSEDAPFNFPGFSLFCVTIAMMIAVIQSVMIKGVPSILS